MKWTGNICVRCGEPVYVVRYGPATAMLCEMCADAEEPEENEETNSEDDND